MKKITNNLNKDDYIKRAIPYLTPKQATVMQMRYIDGLSYDKIADSLCIYNDTARKIMCRAKKVIHNAIEAGLEPEQIRNNMKKTLTSTEKKIRKLKKIRLRVQNGI